MSISSIYASKIGNNVIKRKKVGPRTSFLYFLISKKRLLIKLLYAKTVHKKEHKGGKMYKEEKRKEEKRKEKKIKY